MRSEEGTSLGVLRDNVLVGVFLEEGCIDHSWSAMDATIAYD